MEKAKLQTLKLMSRWPRLRKSTKHSPIKSPHPKKYKTGSKSPQDDCIREAILMAVNSLTKKMDTQTEPLLKFERRTEENTAAITENKVNRGFAEKRQRASRGKQTAKESVTEQAGYNRKWNLSLAEKDGEAIREVVIGILTRVVPISVERLHETIDVVHRL
ncbi:hypothetical protein NFI96_000324, partial [Prochilodus magdalenae]